MMNDNIDMDYAMNDEYDEQVLANMKTLDDEIASPEVVVETEPDVLIKFDETNNGDSGLDPLQDNTFLTQTTVPTNSNFPWLFQENQLLCDVTQPQQQPTVKLTTPRTKRASRVCKSSNEFKSSAGQVWLTERPTDAAEREMPIAEQQAHGKGPAESVEHILEPWVLLFDVPILESMLLHINEHIRATRTQKCKQQNVQLHELRSWLGLCYLCGIFRNATHNGPLEELWAFELGNAIFRATMPHKRFEFIADCLNQSEAKILKLWDKFLINCRSYYAPSNWCSIGEHIIPLDDSAECNFKCSLTQNPERCGLRLITLCDAKTLYMAHAILAKYRNQTETEIMQVVCDLKSTGRHVTLPTDYVKLGLCQRLLQRQLSTSGVLSKNAPELPTNWCPQNGDTLYAADATLKATPAGYVLSNGLHSQYDVYKVQQKSETATAAFHELCNRYSSTNAIPAALSSSWTLKLLYTMLDIAVVNAWILFRLSPKGNATIELRDYQRQLGLFLTQQRLQQRAHLAATTPLVVKLQIREMLGISLDQVLNGAVAHNKLELTLNTEAAAIPANVTLGPRHGDKMRRCKPCTQMKRQTKTRTRCQQCLAHRCPRHLVARCFQCMGITAEQVAQLEQNPADPSEATTATVV